MAPQVDGGSHIPIVDIRRNEFNDSMLDEIYEGLQLGTGKERTLPSMILYDEKGLKLFEDITYLEEYYLTNSEIEVLSTYAADIADKIPSEARIVELGSGYDSTFQSVAIIQTSTLDLISESPF